MNITRRKKKALAVMLILSFFAASLASHPAQVQAAPTLTMYPGDEFTVWVDPTLDLRGRKIESSDSAVADVSDKDKKLSDFTSVLHLIAKKPGKATVSAKVVNSTRIAKLNIVVEKLDMTAEILPFQDNEKLVLSVKNNMKLSFHKCSVEISFKDKKGKLIKKGSWYVYGPLAGKTAYNTIIMSNTRLIGLTKEERAKVDPSKCTAEVTAIERSYDRNDVVMNSSNKIRLLEDELETEEDERFGKHRFHCTLKNKAKQNMYVNVYIKLYDSKNRLINILEENLYQFRGKSEEDVILEISRKQIPEYDHYKIEVQAHYTKSAKNNSSNRIKL